MNSQQACSHCLDMRACKVGTGGVVTCVLRTEANAAAVRRLAELGIRCGANITAGQRTPGGGRVVSVAGSQLALDAETLRCLHVAA